jgi:hypothetical protein
MTHDCAEFRFVYKAHPPAHIGICVGGCNAVDGQKNKQDVSLFLAAVLKHWVGIRFVNRAPTRPEGEVKPRVTPMMLPPVLWWHSHVQSVIDSDPNKVDGDWNWRLYFRFDVLPNASNSSD